MPEISKSDIDDARAEFDPILLASVFDSSERRSAIEGDFDVYSMTANAGVVQRPTIDTEIMLSGGSRRAGTDDSELIHSGDWSMKVTQSLLRRAGTAVNLVELREARNRAEMTSQALREFVLAMVYQVENAYWELVLVQETMRIRQQVGLVSGWGNHNYNCVYLLR